MWREKENNSKIDHAFQKNAMGKELFEKVCQHLDLIEKDYFGLQYVDERLPHHLKVSSSALMFVFNFAYDDISRNSLFPFL